VLPNTVIVHQRAEVPLAGRAAGAAGQGFAALHHAQVEDRHAHGDEHGRVMSFPANTRPAADRRMSERGHTISRRPGPMWGG